MPLLWEAKQERRQRKYVSVFHSSRLSRNALICQACFLTRVFCVARGGKLRLASSGLTICVFWQSVSLVECEDHLIYKILSEQLLGSNRRFGGALAGELAVKMH